MPDHARRLDLGGDVDDRADDPARRDRGGDGAARVDPLEAEPLEVAAEALEEPPRHAVLHAHHDGVGAEQGGQARGELGQAVGLDAEEDDVGRPEPLEAVGHGRPDLEVPVRRADANPPLRERTQLGAAGEERHVLAGARQPGAHVGADRARAHDQRSHRPGSASAAATARRWIFPVAVRGIVSTT